MPFNVLAVCIGNVCRSPVAERLLTSRLDDPVGFAVGSVGIRAMVGRSMTEGSARELANRDVAPDKFVARQLIGSEVGDSDLVLTASTAIRRAVLEEFPGALRRAFTWKEFAALVLGSTAPTPAALVDIAATRRSEVAHLDLDTDDPIGRSPDVYARVASEIDGAITVIARALRASAET